MVQKPLESALTMLEVAARELQIGQTVEGTVTKVSSSAIVVELPGKVRGLLRREWMPVEYRRISCRHVVSRGAKIEAVVRGRDRQSRYIFLDFTRLISDPWQEAKEILKLGAVVRGEVYNIKPYGAFVELEDGISGLVPATAIPELSGKPVEAVLETGDFVEARIVEIDTEKRRLTLSIKKHAAALQLHRQRILSQQLQDPKLLTSLVEHRSSAAQQPLRQLLGGKGRIKRILIVDDNPRFLRSVSRWLERAGYEMETADNAEEGCYKAIAGGFDLVLMDVRLPKFSGIEATRRIQQERPGTQVALVSGEEQALEGSDLSAIELVGIISKFGGPGAIEQLIVNLESDGHGSQSIQLAPHAASREVQLLQRMSRAKGRARDLKAAIRHMLGELIEVTSAQTGIVFHLDPSTDRVSVIAQVGVIPPSSADVLDLKYSPVRDVIRDRELLLENDVLGQERRFAYLLRYLMFESCIGVPIESRETDSVHHALFLFHRSPGKFSASHVEDTLLAAKLMALEIERCEFDKMLEEAQAFAVAGMLRSGLLHEVNNNLNDIELSVRNLQADYTELTRNPSLIVSNTRFLHHMGESLQDLADAGSNLRQIASSFLGLIRAEDQALLEVGEVLQHAREVVEPEAGPDILIKLLHGPDIPPVWGVASRLERVFVNVLLNAVQQIKHAGAKAGMLIMVTSHEPADAERPVKIRCIDTGPGIHRKDFEHIFERGVSTRRGGSGLGLFISRGLIESMGGRILVEDSLLFVGSRFLIELPAAVSLEGTDGRSSE